MTPERLAQIQEPFDTVREVPANREMLLAAADPDIRREVESLLDQLQTRSGSVPYPVQVLRHPEPLR